MTVPELKIATANEFKIEKGIPGPSNWEGRVTKYPFGKMDVGDSFLIGSADYKAVTNAAQAWGKKNSRKFSVRRTPDGHRCWRVA